jgi:hypothetical protein
MRTEISLLTDRSGPPGAREISSMILALLFPPNSPSTPQGARVDMGSPDGRKPKSEQKREIGDATESFFTVRMKKWLPRPRGRR